MSLWRVGVKSEMLTLIKKLNDTAVVLVKTPLGVTEKFTLPSICKQGTVLMPPICSVSVGECCEEINQGGVSIGSAIIRSLAFVDDLMGLNTNLLDVGYSHDKTTFFASKKKMPLNEKKCNGLIVNNKKPYAVPVLYVNGIIMELEEKIRYLGDIFNAHGTNTDLLQDRVSRGISCLISCISECSEVTQGCREIETMLLLYKLLFLSTVLYNSEAWSCLNQNEVSQLERLPQRFLKRVLQVPKSTPNTLVLLELGLLPIASEIHARQLRFLYHILSLPIEDPVRQTYEQQKLFPQEKNWYNEVILLMKLYAIDIK